MSCHLLVTLGTKMPCEESTSSVDQCHRRCHCRDGNLVSCYRIRKQFTAMSPIERQRFINAFKLASSSPQYQSYYEHITTLHSRIPSKFLHHMPQIFLPWHRWYLMQFENFLRQIDCRITIPYWDWTRESEHWTQAAVWSPRPSGLGGNGILPNNCVRNGPFQQKKFHLPWSAGGGCIKREFNFSCSLPNLQKVRDLIQLENFTLFEQTVREQFHTKFHDCVGGTMLHHSTASFSPEFWLLHGFIDKLWADWQKKGVTFQFQYYTEIYFAMPGSGQFSWEYLDQDNLPGGLRIVYDNSPP